MRTLIFSLKSATASVDFFIAAVALITLNIITPPTISVIVRTTAKGMFFLIMSISLLDWFFEF